MVHIAKVCGEQLLVIINDILDVTKMEENKTVLLKEPFSLREAVEESVEMVVFDTERKGIELVCCVDSKIKVSE